MNLISTWLLIKIKCIDLKNYLKLIAFVYDMACFFGEGFACVLLCYKRCVVVCVGGKVV